MTKDEAKAAFLAAKPVQHGGIEYDRISALIYRIKAGAVVMSVELASRQANSVTITTPERVEITQK